VSKLRIAHFSDTHVLSLQEIGPGRFLNKRWTGAINLALNRSRHYRVDIFERLLDAVKAIEPDHSVCTGDLVNLALEPEFERVGELLGDRFAPEELTLVPGNHDYYVKEAVTDGLFESSFGRWQPKDIDSGQDVYPVVRVRDEFTIVGLNSAITTPVFMATGRVGDEQLSHLKSLLADERRQGRFCMVLIHHPLLPEPKRRMESTRRLEDAAAVIAALGTGEDARPDLVVHGHNHEFKRMTVPETDIPLIQVASASRAGSKHRAEFNVYVIEDGRMVEIERHIHDPETGRFVVSNEAGEPIS
jgi:3',5'-cyclic AMP phosphodiesterase CpdA